MLIQQFDGGVSSRLAPQRLNPTQGAVYENIDNTSSVLAPMKDKTATTVDVDEYHFYFEAGNEWLSSTVKTDYLEFQSKMYLTDRTNQPQKYSDGQYNLLGITGPAAAPTMVNNEKAEPIETFKVKNLTSSGDLPDADLGYLMVNVKGSTYSNAFRFTVYASNTDSTTVRGEVVGKSLDTRYPGNSVDTGEDANTRSVKISDITDDIEDSARVYRYYSKAWRLVGSLTSSSSTLTDSTYDISSNAELDFDDITNFNGTYQYVYTYYNVNDGTESVPSPISEELVAESGYVTVSLPSTSTDPQVTHKIIYRVGGEGTKFTQVTRVDANVTSYDDKLAPSDLEGSDLESENYYPAPAGLKFLAESYAMLFGAKGAELRFTPIALPNAWPPEYSIQFDDDITGLGPVANGMLVFTKKRTFIVTGTGPTTLAQQSLRGDQGCIAFESIQQAELGTLIWASLDGLCASSGNDVTSLTKLPLGDIVLDPVDSVVNNEVYYCHNADGTTLAWDYRFATIPKWLNLDVQSLSTADNELYGYKDGVLYTLFTSDDNLTFKYTSPRFIEQSMVMAKTYKKFYFRSEGDIIINILIDDVPVVTNLALSTKDTHELQVPQANQRSYYVQFEIQGTGTVQEYGYLAKAGDLVNV